MTTDPQQAEWFAAFWALYPRKVAKLAAFKAWRKVATSEAVVEQIMAGLRAQLPAWARKGKNERQFIPYPSTWINQMRWLDEIEQVSPLGAKRVINCEKCADTGVVFTGRTGSVLRRCTCVVGLLPGELVGVSA